ncbi:MAG TPA: ribonuclease E/G, partial [Chondromyces sp.]|nr:ribonuclease E/G [Chondromyces sp.]
ELLSRAHSSKAPSLLFERKVVLEELFSQMAALGEGTFITDDRALLAEVQGDIRFQEEKWSVNLHLSHEDLFSAWQLAGELEKALKKIVWLKNGGYLVIEQTEAMVVIDVNTGKYTGKSDQAQTILLTNKEAAKEVSRQLRLRDLSGIILVDFIDMHTPENKRAVEKILKEESKKDSKTVYVREFTSLGLMQLTRKKTKKPLLETVTVPCSVCNGTGRVLSAETVAFQLERKLLEYSKDDHEAILLELTSDVRAILAGAANMEHKKLEEILYKKIYYRVIQHPAPYGEVALLGSIQELSEKGIRP